MKSGLILAVASVPSSKQTAPDVFESQGVHLPHLGRQESRHNDSEAEEPSITDGHTKNRSLPLLTFLEMLKEKIGKDGVEVGSICTLFGLFGDDDDPKIKKSMKVMLGKLQQGQHGGGGRPGAGAAAG